MRNETQLKKCRCWKCSFEFFSSFLKNSVSNSKTQTMTGFEWMLLVLLSVVWGGSFFFNGIALREFPTLSIVTARVGLAALALLLLMRMLGQGIQLNRQILKAFFGMSFFRVLGPAQLSFLRARGSARRVSFVV